MPHFIKTLFCLLAFTPISLSFSQLKSGKYDWVHLAYNPQNKLITGYFENYSGLDEETGNPKFSCLFYFTGLYRNGEISIDSYDPADKQIDFIKGKLKIKNANTIQIRLNEEHGGCWNVLNFSNEFVDFSLTEKANWLEIRYINVSKAYFYKETQEASKRKAYLVKGDVVYIDKIDKSWVHCKYYGKTTTEGWLKTDALNKD